MSSLRYSLKLEVWGDEQLTMDALYEREMRVWGNLACVSCEVFEQSRVLVVRTSYTAIIAVSTRCKNR